MSDAASLIRPTIFLDTNALQYMSSYLRKAKEYKLPPFAETPMIYDEVENVLKQHLPQGIVNYLMNGCKTIAFLEKEVDDADNDGLLVNTSRISKLEMLHGILDGRAHARMALVDIPYRMRIRLKDLSELISMYLDRDDYQQLYGELDDLFNNIRYKVGLPINFVEEEDNILLIATFAEILQSTIFMDVFDCWNYSCAIVSQAEYIITFDRYFRRVINNIHNPINDDWKQVQNVILRELERAFPVATGVTLALPMVRTSLPKETPRPWE
ncbi:hypothetical protein Desku_2481 [Desulfofundulus kuznetsovii DSM 6115]|uniref:DUF4935 domain-containing protein n=1 Tax=Desulfofundulus kuznetsovii (strain DSM 6115 / VKM B-1805 / 17) TaxID=760568 RepID=A0AAU8PJH0_DESK7|nr:hypothetical protein Desku_2481 [Desulfofundulus kuznetsovii DSM 6115]